MLYFTSRPLQNLCRISQEQLIDINMKRKLDMNDVPNVEAHTNSFEAFNLDPRLLQAVANSGFTIPTPVQTKAIPLALEGKDILAKSRTGSGKTAAYILPILHRILLRKIKNPKEKATVTLVLVPTRELSDQVTKAFSTFSEYCSKEIKTLSLTQRLSDAVLNAKLQELPDIVVSTPGRASQLVGSGALSLQNIQRLVVDEADLVLSYGYEDDIKDIAKALPKGIQTFLISATLSSEVDQLKTIFCRDPAIIKIDEKEEEGERITQYVVKCGEEEKFLLIFVIFKLKLVKGKCIVFVADVDRSYRLKLYLEQYGIKSCVLNSELPVNSRLHTVEEFNKGLYDILIAADDQEVIGGIHRKLKPSQQNQDSQLDAEITDEEDENDNDNDEPSEPSAKKPKLERSKDFGVSRGIDFQNVSYVLNFDLPTTSKSYTHRIGRTARAGQSGTAISFVIPRSEYNRHKPTSHPSTRNNEKVLNKITEKQNKKGNKIQDYVFDMKAVDGFRYRMNDALRAVTRVAVREARAREIKQELIRSEKLRKHFEENPEDLRYLQRRSDNGSLGGGGVVRVQGHMKHVPDYLLPGAKGKIDGEGANTIPGMNGDSSKKKRRNGFKKGGKKFVRGGRKNDPLKTFRSKSK